MENIGQLHPETFLDCLNKYQHLDFVQTLYKLIKNEAEDDFKPLLFKRLIKWVK